ncbi:4-hydroxy-3-polyprenylbenzoate decarboxylase [Krasilnikovia cinnamomea]|uniref:4-hydroxy-3-polyprenylbenzoate decarboxylase n=1 Tax=Krasilnikovia cinnamomea TaxID=349313 RepID=A0A4Q7ZTH1_9ACTN|nr:UbiD family decarboxylase [Krasilnikovia cinnamomea]RZU53883.1 4-hydroxy-3-polyprenylbenzoate decarboxylase [Krasilnikovia cinnamomea]
MITDLRTAVAALESMPGELVRVDDELPARFGPGAHYARWAGTPAPPPTGPGPAVLFEKVRPVTGPPSRVLMGLYGTRRRAAALLGLRPGQVPFRLRDAVAAPLAPVPAAEPGRWPRHVLPTDLSALPIPVLTGEDAGPYLTLGAVLATDPETGVRNLSVHRMCVRGTDRLTIWMVPGRDLGLAYERSLARGRSLPVAIHLGLSPAVMLSSCCPTSLVPTGLDELAVAGSLAGAPVELLPCRSVAAEFIADAEYVLEGEITAELAAENPDGEAATPEFLGYQGRAHPALPVVRVTAVTARPNPILQAVSGPGYEQSHLLGFGMEAAILDDLLRRDAPIRAVHCHTSGGGQLMTVLQWAKRDAGDDETVRAASLAVLERFRMVKLVVGVDSDVDVESEQDLWWAMATRLQGDRDIVVLPDREGFPLDPSQHTGYSTTISADGRTAKTLFDCTVPYGQRHRFRRPAFSTPPPPR